MSRNGAVGPGLNLAYQNKNNVEFGNWLQWAQSKADWVDPLIDLSDIIIGSYTPDYEVNSEKNSESKDNFGFLDSTNYIYPIESVVTPITIGLG